MQVRSAVLSGALRAGTRVPSSRAMASQLGVARASVVSAYEQLLAEGYVESRHGSGTFISPEVAGLATRRRRAPRPIKPAAVPASARAFPDFERSMLQGDARPFNTGRTLVDARTAETWRSLTHRAVRRLGPNDLGYADPAGLAELRATICDYLGAARAVRCEPDQIVITAGTQQAIDIAIRVLLAPEDEVWVEDPGYPLTHAQLLLAKVRPHAIPVDGQGLIVDAGRRAAPRARAVFVTPSHQFPTGVAMSMARRLELLAWARQSGAFIVEDDYTSEFRYSGPPLSSLQGLDDSEQVIYALSGPAQRLRGGAPDLAAGFRRRALSDRPPAADASAGRRFGVDAARPLCRTYPPHAPALSRAARRAGGDADAPRGGPAGCGVARSGHASRRIFARHFVRNSNRGGGPALLHRRPRDQPLLPRSPPAAWPDARLFRVSAAADSAGGRAACDARCQSRPELTRTSGEKPRNMDQL